MFTFDEVMDRYRRGYYPMYDREGGYFFWYRPRKRAVLMLTEEVVDRARRMRKRVRTPFEVTENRRVDEVLQHLSGMAVRDDSWVDGPVVSIYRDLDRRGVLRTVEALNEGRLAGAVLGLELPRVFVAETMFRLEPDASKICLCEAVERYAARGARFIDTQQPHPPDHPSARLGEQEIDLTDYLRLLDATIK